MDVMAQSISSEEKRLLSSSSDFITQTHNEKIVVPEKKLRSLSDLSELLPDAVPGQKPPAPVGRAGHDGRGKAVRILIDRKGRKGKTVTIVAGLQHNPDTMEEIGRILKQHCGAGGTVKEGNIEIQGDHRERVSAKLIEMNYRVS
jgi:translation initiation factor 1